MSAMWRTVSPAAPSESLATPAVISTLLGCRTEYLLFCCTAVSRLYCGRVDLAGEGRGRGLGQVPGVLGTAVRRSEAQGLGEASARPSGLWHGVVPPCRALPRLLPRHLPPARPGRPPSARYRRASSCSEPAIAFLPGCLPARHPGPAPPRPARLPQSAAASLLLPHMGAATVLCTAPAPRTCSSCSSPPGRVLSLGAYSPTHLFRLRPLSG